MSETEPRPRLRNVEIFPLPDGKGTPKFGLRDPQQISPHVLCVSPDVAFALQFMDGSRTLEEVGSEYQRRLGKPIPVDLLRKVVQMLDQSYFLDNGTFAAYSLRLVESFRQAEVREAYHAGASYPQDGVGLVQCLSAFFSTPGGPGLPNGARAEREIPGMIAPHIDLRVGGCTYAWAYKELAEARRPDVVVVLGTGHSGVRNLFSLTRKRFATPLGELSVDADFVRRLSALYPYDLFAGEISHRTEHAIEFQVLFLQLLFGNGISLVPILCSFSHSMARQGGAAGIIGKFVEALRRTIQQDGRRVCMVASADLSHVGPRYGDAEGFVGDRLARVTEADREMLAYVEKVDAEGFLDYIGREGDRRRICGLSPIYTMLKAIEARRGTVLSHSHGEMDSLGSICSYASVIFEP